jgi:hypothetical protein
LARVSPEQMVAIQRSYAVGFAQLGTQNWLVQAANGLAAVMLACGQDVAYLPECATGFLDLDVTEEGDLYASATLPSLLVGTVGGGTQKGTAPSCSRATSRSWPRSAATSSSRRTSGSAGTGPRRRGKGRRPAPLQGLPARLRRAIRPRDRRDPVLGGAALRAGNRAGT